MSLLRPYIGVKLIYAEPETRDGIEGYKVLYIDEKNDTTYESWSPKDVFEASYYPIVQPDKINEKDVYNFIKDSEQDKIGLKTALVKAELLNGYEIIETSSCAEPENYDQEVGVTICKNRITDKIWDHLGFVLNWARKGVKR